MNQISELRPKQRKSESGEIPGRERDIIKKMFSPSDFNFAPPLYFLVIGLFVYLGWRADLENYMTPESGLGYALGIIGGVAMLVLLLYPLRKRVKAMSGWGPIRYWFRFHMVLGLIGPLLILYHCNFKLGALNSNITLFAMALVVASGIIGRYIYGKIHYGLYGNSVSLQRLQVDKAVTKVELAKLFVIAPDLRDQLHDFEIIALKHSSNAFSSLFRLLLLNLKAKLVFRRALQSLKEDLLAVAAKSDWSPQEYRRHLHVSKQYLGAHLKTVVRIAQFRFFERLFAIWHVVHIPFFVLLVITGIYHVFAVHKY